MRRKAGEFGIHWQKQLAVFLIAAAAPFAGVAQTPAGSQQLIQTGQSLFRGTTRFANGGPACAECHSVATLPFPGGGTMGPDLTHEYSKATEAGMKAVLQSLLFPTMAPLFHDHELTPQEQAALLAFLKDADQRSHGNSSNPERIFAGIGAAGLLIVLAVAWFLGRHRVRSVRGALLKRALRERRGTS